MDAALKVRHRWLEVDGLEIFFREAGRAGEPVVLLLHGSPSSSLAFREVMPRLAEVAHVIAPDFPGAGLSASPPVEEHDYTFASLATTIERLLGELGVEGFFVYLHDFGAPVGYHLATRSPGRIRGLIVQSGNAHQDGLGEPWDAVKAYWSDPTDSNREAIGEWNTFEGTRDTYLAGLPEDACELVAPELWHFDWERLSRPGMTDVQFTQFLDYANHVARFDELAAYHRDHQPPALVLWGRRDPYFEVEEVLAYHRALEEVEIHVYDGAHFLLETHGSECAELMRAFVLDHSDAGRRAAPMPEGPR